MKAAVLLSGCGAYDGSEIHESVLLFLHLARAGFEIECFAPSMEQHHVVDHRDGTERSEVRNVLVESARLARGQVLPLVDLDESAYDCLVLPGGSGVSKNFTKWAFLGAAAGIHPAVRDAVLAFVDNRRPVLSLGMAATTLAKAVQTLECSPRVTIGPAQDASDPVFGGLVAGLANIGAIHVPCGPAEACVDTDNRLVTLSASLASREILDLDAGIEAAVRALVSLSDSAAVSRITAPDSRGTALLERFVPQDS